MEPRHNLTGRRFTRLLVLSRAKNGPQGHSRWECICDCGARTEVASSCLVRGSTRSCGCLSRGLLRGAVARKYPKESGAASPLYTVWRSLLSRCYREENPAYKDYGGRGIAVCDEWRDYGSFRLWALASGYRADLQIDRIDNNGNYEPGNCQWATRHENQRNKRDSYILTAFGETKPLVAWIEDPRCVVEYQTAWHRIKRGGWSADEALSTPPADSNAPGAKLTPQQVLEIRGSPSKSARELAAQYGVSRSTINNVRAGVTWGDLP
jgi:hypothetical protein